MAAPAESTIQDLNGTWVIDKTLSNDPDAIFKLQGLSWLTRKAIGIATITLKVTQSKNPDTGDVTLDVAQLLTGGLKGTSEHRVLNWSEKPHQDHIFGSVIGQSRFVKAGDADADGKRRPAVEVQTEISGDDDGTQGEAVAKFLRGEILANGDATDGFVVDAANDYFMQSWVRSQESGWTGEQIWGFEMVDGVRRHTRRIVVAKDGQVEKVRLVYTFVDRSTK
ncbi:uncharacterized protein PADG_01563 [Paracoccidioides brasiliensis Pb18]|uniref:Lipocalin-like domain-containing protein n=1 Tax=Paracoccidioides brasiliensis (strain Pb18) TaxID=502780 RepID=C1G3P7_PARBD|nr:uncharacterized protein PADG_01563 [Paracoccidioides brasiliensis Pb18]EEH45413.1 hypothetical protein PADG_01563 [Paracoccidioides brasiliensis Pb18]